MDRHDVRTLLLRAAAAAAMLALPTGSALSAQQAERTGRIKGKIVSAGDAEGVQSARVTLAGTDLGALADMDGRYFLATVPPGSYELRFLDVSNQAVLARKVIRVE